MSLLSIVASSSAFCLPASPPPKGSSIDSDWSTKNKKQPGFLRLISAWYAMVCPPLFLASREHRLSRARGHRLESCRDHPQNAAERQRQPLTSPQPGLASSRGRQPTGGCTIVNSQEEFHDSMWMNHWRAPTDVPVRCGRVVHEDRVGLLARAGGLSHRREPRPRGALP